MSSPLPKEVKHSNMKCDKGRAIGDIIVKKLYRLHKTTIPNPIESRTPATDQVWYRRH